MQIQTIKGSHFIPGRMAIIEKMEESISKDVMGVQIGSVTMENTMRVPKNQIRTTL